MSAKGAGHLDFSPNKHVILQTRPCGPERRSNLPKVTQQGGKAGARNLRPDPVARALATILPAGL